MTQCHIPKELNLPQHYVKRKSCKVDIAAKKTHFHFNHTFQEGQNLPLYLGPTYTLHGILGTTE
jgi:hypothetical protein